MKCDECRERLIEYLEGLPDPEARSAFERHLAECSECRVRGGRISEAPGPTDGMRKIGIGQIVENAVMDRILCRDF